MNLRRLGRTFLPVAVLTAAVMVGLALLLAKSQSDTHTDIENNFRDRASIAAALTESLFSATSTTGQADQAKIYGGQVNTKLLDAQLHKGGNNSNFMAVVDPNGKVIASSSGTPKSVVNELNSSPDWLTGVLDGKPFGLSGVLGPEGNRSIALATPVVAPNGERRALVTGIDPPLLTAFIGGYLGRVPSTSDGHAYILDQDGRVVATERSDVTPGSNLNASGLPEAVAGGSYGSFGGGGRLFAASPIANSDWSVVTTASDSNLFSSVNGADKWIPWVILIGLAIAAAAAMAGVRRSFADRARLAESNAELAEAQERLQATNQALARRAEQLARSNAELDQFASVASHDLQEPLRKVQAFSARALETEGDNLSDKGRDFLERASGSAARMQDLIDDLLRFARVGTRTQPFEETDMTELTREVLIDLETAIEQAGAKVELGELPTVAVDRRQASQLMQNLISNALKFRREGVTPEVRIEGSAGPRFAEIRVIDNGIGFAPEYSDRIFRVFERLHGRGSYPGTGIGLALCRKVAERHGGTVGAEGRPGEGATFIVRLPLHHDDDEELSDLNQPTTEGAE